MQLGAWATGGMTSCMHAHSGQVAWLSAFFRTALRFFWGATAYLRGITGETACIIIRARTVAFPQAAACTQRLKEPCIAACIDEEECENDHSHVAQRFACNQHVCTHCKAAVLTISCTIGV